MDFKAALRRLKKNLNALREREAKFGRNVPPELLNQIEDHEQAMALTEQAGRGELGLADWRETLKPLLVSLDLFGPFLAPPPPLQRPRRADHFTNREKELTQLLADLQPGRVVALCGPGGMGKSALAAEAVWQAAIEQRFPDGILFHSFYNQPDPAMALETLALSLGEEPKPSPAAAAQRALAGKRCLLLLDGTEATADLGAVLAVAGGCGVLVTSRDRGQAQASRQDLKPLPVDEAASLLQQWGGALAGDGEIAGQICRQVGRLPLAVRLAGKYLAETDTPAADYLAWLAQTPIEALSQGRHREESVAVLLEKSLAEVSPTARELLGVAGLLALAPFSLAPLAAALGLDQNALRRPLAELVRFGLVLREAPPQPSPEGEGATTSPPLGGTEGGPLPAANTPSLAPTALDATGQQPSPQPSGEETASRPKGRGSETSPPLGPVLSEVEGGTEGGLLPAANAPSLAPTALDATGQQPSPQPSPQGRGGETSPPAGGIEGGSLQVSHALIHTYARETLPPAAETVQRLVAYYEAWVEEQISHQAAGFRRIDGERLHLIRLLDECLGREAWAEAKRLAWAMDDYLFTGSRSLEWQQVAQAALTAARRLGDRRDEGAFLEKLGLAASNLGQVSQAIDYYEQALRVAREIENKKGEGIAVGNLGLAYSALGQVERAIDFYQQALAIAQEIGDRRGEGADLGSLGLAYSALGQVERAIEYHEQALVISREIGDRRGEGNRLGNLGNAYRDLGQVERAIDFYQQALAIAQEIGDRRNEGAWLGNLGLAYRDLGQVERAIDFYQQALAIAQEIGDRRGEGNHLGNLGNAYSDLGQVERAIEYYQQALAIAQEIGDRRGEGNRLGNLGIAYSALGQVEQAIDFYQQALAIAQEIGDRRNEGAWLGNLGNAYRALGQVERAIDYHEQALVISREIGDRRGEGNHLGNLGLAYRDLGQVERAIEYYQQALAIAQEIGDRRGEGNRLGNLGLAYRALGQVERAIDFYQQALAIAQEIGDRRGEGSRLGNLGLAYRDLGQVERAIDFYQQALAIAQEIGDRRGEGIRLGSLGLAYSDLGQVERARQHWSEALAIFEEIKSPIAEQVRGWLAELGGG